MALGWPAMGQRLGVGNSQSCRQHFQLQATDICFGSRNKLGIPSAPSSSCSRTCTSSNVRHMHGRKVVQPVQVVMPVAEGAAVLSKIKNITAKTKSSSEGVLEEVLAPVLNDMQEMAANLKSIVANRHPTLLAAADQIFGAGGKRLRPVVVFLVARATSQLIGARDITEKHRRLAEITEMIHTASLVHDDVLDDCSLRRGKRTVNSMFGNGVAVLIGDFFFAQSSWFLANLDNLEVIKLISQVIADFADGEIRQAANLYDVNITLEKYLDKSFYKTASLIAASARSSSVFSDVPEEVKQSMYNYGKHLGLAFQIVDDVLDFTQSTAQLGKPQGQDLAHGNLTAPVIFALQREPALYPLIQQRFSSDKSLQMGIELVNRSGGIAAAQELARQQGDLAKQALHVLPEGPLKRSLVLMVDYVLDRLY